MMDNFYKTIQRELTFGNNGANDNSSTADNNHARHSRLLVRKVSDQNGGNNQQSVYDTSEGSPSSFIRLHKQLSRLPSSDASYDTDGAVGASKHRHHTSSNDYENFLSPKVLSRRAPTQVSRPLQVPVLKHRFSQLPPLAPTASLGNGKNHNDKDDDLKQDASPNHQRLRMSRRLHASPTTAANHLARSIRPIELVQHGISRAPISPASPLRIIFMRHAERANQALGADWFSKAYCTNVYKAFDGNLPLILPKRRFEQAYEFDVPLTVRGLRSARLSGDAMMRNKYVIDMCISSVALRCVQTCERILTGMESRDRVPIRLEPGLFECPHFNQKIVDSFMTKKELLDNKYNIKHEYRSIISKVNIPETLEDYFERSATVIRGIMERYGHQGGTILIVTHAPGLLALTDVLKNIKTNPDTFYRTVAAYPPLAMHVADFDGSKWNCTNHPYNIAPIGWQQF